MKPILFALTLAATPLAGYAQDSAATSEATTVADVVQAHILPRFEALAQRSADLSQVAAQECTATSAPLRAAYGEAFDAWIAASHLRFGPSEVGDRAFALAFWPDSRGATPNTLATLIADQDPVAGSAAEYANVSIAARGFYAMEFLLYDDAISTSGDAAYRCDLVQAVAANIAATSQAIAQDWQDDYADRLLHPTEGGTYRSDNEALREVFKALTTGLEFTADTRLGRPMGTFERPRPTRAEAWRSDRSVRHVELSLLSLRDLATRMAGAGTDLASEFNTAFDYALIRLSRLDDPALANVVEAQGRLHIEVIEQGVQSIRTLARDELGPQLGVAAGFNSLDGD